MRTITITAWQRPHYLAQALESLRVANPEGYTLVCGLEPDNGETVRMCKAIDWIPTVIHKHPHKRGVRDNPFFLLNDVFGRMGSVFNIYLEEDVIISPDAVRMANWYWDITRPNQERWLSLNYFHPGSRTDDPVGVMESKNFNALGMVITKPSWERWLKPNWYNDARPKTVYGPDHTGWDWCMTAMLAQEARVKTLTPILSRSNHIGRDGGVHASAEFHDETFPHIKINTDPNPGDYVVRKEDGSIETYV